LNVFYHELNNSLYIKLSDEKISKSYACDSREINCKINLDFNKEKQLIGVEIMNASKKLPETIVNELKNGYNTLIFEVTYDDLADASYIYLSIGKKVKRTYPCDPREIDGMINLDFNKKGQLIGIEILDASKKLPKKILEKI